jgi:hypothetical protein
MQKRHKVAVEDNDALMPVEWMLAVLRDPEAEQHRRDRMAEVAAPYLHPRLNAIEIGTTNRGNGVAGGDINIVQIFAVPRGGRVTQDGSITIDGEVVTELSNVEPYTGTPPLTALTDQRAEPERERFEVTEIEPPANVTRLDTFKAKRDDEPSGAA